MTYEIAVGEELYVVELTRGARAGEWQCRVREPGATDFRALQFEAVSSGRDVLSLLLEGKSYEVRRDAAPTAVQLRVNGESYVVEVRDPRSLRSRRAAGAGDGPARLAALMPGKVVRVLVLEGAEVEAGQPLLVIEAMKMQNEMKSPRKGVVRKLLVREGDALNAGDALAVVE